jgi:hypothetical protein
MWEDLGGDSLERVVGRDVFKDLLRSEGFLVLGKH